MGKATLTFTDNPDGTLAIAARHDGEFNPNLQSHACLRAVSQFLPQVLGAAGTRVDGELGTRVVITDGERYHALRALALLGDEQANAIAKQVDSGRHLLSEADYDAAADRLVQIARGTPQ
ncbi:MAG: hypothetical protein JO269_11240 [Burkholderiaceae bacterium]|nr:hypothetical protein [Burkholderiaceae bacterium]